jgi:hypothetical protein
MASMPSRIAVFILVSAGLIVLAITLAPSAPDLPSPAATAEPAAVAVPGSELIPAAGRRKARLIQAARAFIGVFLRYEVGDLQPSVARSVERLTITDFGRYLLDARPRQIGDRRAARIVKVETAFLDPAADRALVHGVARRPDGPEELAFVFVLRDGRWLAARAAE